jgi:hypothetical protein
MVTADGKTYENGAVGFYIRDYNMPLDNMAVTTQIFLGTSMVCAQCHNHPFDKWTQMDYYQMAAHTYGMTGTNGLSIPCSPGVSTAKNRSQERKRARQRASWTSCPGHRAQGCGKAMTRDPPPAALQHGAGPDRPKSWRLPHDYNTPTRSRSRSSSP